MPPPLAPQQPVAAQEPARRSGCGFFIVGLLLLAGIAGLIYALMFTDALATIQQAFGGGSGGQATAAPTAPAEATATVQLVEVPALIGLTEQDALNQLAALGFKEKRNTPRSDLAPRATVIEQDVAAGTLLPQGSEVPFTLSLGPEQVDVPDVTRQQIEPATAALSDAGFVVQQTGVPSTDIPAGFVISQNPPGNVKLAQGSTVEIVVSLGDVVQFPNVIGTQRASAVDTIRNTDGLRMDVVDEQGADRLPGFDSIPANQVVSATANGQPVENGQFVPRNSVIILGVRKP